MISSIVWLILLHMGKINPDHAPWNIYFPLVAAEMFVCMKLLPKITDWLDKILDRKVEGQ